MIFFVSKNSVGVVPKDETEPEEFIFESDAKFGRALFFDLRLSSDRSISCASCHIPALAFTDGKVKSEGVGGNVSFRNSPTLLNVKHNTTFMFDAHITSLEEQAVAPIQDSNEMNILMGDLIARLNEVPHYVEAAKQLYNRELDPWVITRALAAFQRTLKSENSTFDKYLNGEGTLSSDERAGWQLFNDLSCIDCHSLPHFTNYQPLNNGLYKDYGDDPGKYRIAGDPEMMGAFKVPSLRNIALTAPYMHDGSMGTLEEVIDHYAKGGSGGVNQDPRVRKRAISEAEKKYLITFLNALTDTSYMRDFR